LRRRNKKSSIYMFFLILCIAVGAGGFLLYNLPMFERNLPVVDVQKSIYWNLKKPIEINLSDDSGIKFVKVTLRDKKGSIVLAKEVLKIPKNKLSLQVDFPKTGFFPEVKKLTLEIEAIDSSKWNYFLGNKQIVEVPVFIDTKKPELIPVLSSYSIIKGGSALVIFKSADENLKELYIKTNFGKKFYPAPFYKDDHYICLIAWPITQKSFRATLVAKDKAGNISKSRVKLFLRPKNYKNSKINLKKRFLNGKIADLYEELSSLDTAVEPIEKFKYINETERVKNEKTIEKITSKVPKQKVDDFFINPFYPLKNAAAVASFGDHRFFYYEGEKVSESYHLGLDLASTAKADIVSSNDGVVVYADYNGIYGNNLIISHGLGLYSLYGHCSSIGAKKSVNAGEVVAKTGKTGLALGDHLHFGMVVQGVEVRPEEWMDRRWIKLNIIDVISNAKKLCGNDS